MYLNIAINVNLYWNRQLALYLHFYWYLFDISMQKIGNKYAREKDKTLIQIIFQLSVFQSNGGHYSLL